MRNDFLYFILILVSLAFTTCTKKLSQHSNPVPPKDYISYYSVDAYGQGIVSLDLYENEGKYDFTIRDDLWWDVSIGVYKIENDSITFLCRERCGEVEHPFGNTPVVLEDFCPQFDKDAYKIGTTNYGSLKGYRAQPVAYIKGDCVKGIQIFDTDDNIIYEHCVEDIKNNCFQFIFPWVSIYGSALNLDKKAVKFSNDTLELSPNVKLVRR